MANKINFNPRTDELITLDIKSLYTCVNIPKIVNYILNLIYRDPCKYFVQEFDKFGKILPVPTRENLKKLILGTLTDYNIFKTKIGTFKQREGLPMGGCLSPIISN